jgi:stage IV sporulation protein B
MKNSVLTAFCCLLMTVVFPVTAFAQELIVGGQAVGIRIQTKGVLVVGLSPVETAEGSRSPGEESGLREGDRILQVDGKEICGAADLIGAVGRSDGKSMTLDVQREGKRMRLTVQPALSQTGQWMLGLWLQDAVTGIGTITFCDPETGTYGALGHCIAEENSGEPVTPASGCITEAEILSVTPGQAGAPGALNGEPGGKVLGTVERNTSCGIYGHTEGAFDGRTAEVGQAHTGPAVILTTVSGREAQEFAVRITRVYQDGDGEHLILTVTDPQLQAKTGGIVQGMSGSPILQDGMLVGAVTHVFLSDSTRGYGITIQDMLAAAGLAEERAA